MKNLWKLALGLIMKATKSSELCHRPSTSPQSAVKRFVTFVRSDLLHGDAAAVEESEHDFGDAVVAEPPPGIAVPLELGLGNHSSLSAQERTVQVPQQRLLLRVAVHVHAVGWVRFTEGQ